jgi:hypothetical protein
MALNPQVIGLRIARPAETEQDVEKINRPADKQDGHEQMDVPGERIETGAVFRCNQRCSQEVLGHELSLRFS